MSEKSWKNYFLYLGIMFLISGFFGLSTHFGDGFEHFDLFNASLIFPWFVGGGIFLYLARKKDVKAEGEIEDEKDELLNRK